MTNNETPAGSPTGGPVTVPGPDDLPEKMRVHALARLLGRTSREVLGALAGLGTSARSAQSSIDRKTAEQVVTALLAPAEDGGAEPPPVSPDGPAAPSREAGTDAAPAAVVGDDALPEPLPATPREAPGADAPLAPLFAPPAPVFQPPARPGRTRRRARAAEEEPAEEAAAAVEEAPADGVPDVAEGPATDDAATDDADTTAEDGADGADDTDEDAAGRRRRRRGRRGRGRGRGGDDDAAENGDDEPAADAAADADDEPAAEETADAGPAGEESEDDRPSGSRRRRRRRRKGSADDAGDDADDPPNTVTRVRQPREQQQQKEPDGDGVQGVRGSTRLEAKRQRRRDGRDAGRRRQPILSEAEFLARRESVDRAMVVRERGDRVEIGVLEDGVLVEHFVADADRDGAGKSMVGNIYLGRVQNVLPSMEAAFVDIGRGRNAVLYAGEVDWDAAGLGGKARRIEQALSSGDQVLVQVTKDPLGHKGARLTTQISLAGRFLVYVPSGGAAGISRKLPDVERKRLKDMLKEIVPSEAGVIIRTASEGVSHEALERDVRRLQAQWEVVKEKAEKTGPGAPKAPVLLYEEPDLLIKVVRDQFNEDFSTLVVEGDDAWDTLHGYVSHVAPELADRLRRHVGPKDVFAEYRIDEQLLKALDRKVWLPSGGTLVIDRTEAMTVVDVNTGKFTGSGGNLEETVTRNNLEAAEEIVRQLRLRDVGGIIVIDFIDMVLEANRDLVLRRLTECLSRDRTRHQVAEVTSLGLVQMTRKRVGGGLLEHFSEPCEHCRGRGVVVNTDPVVDTGERAENGGRRSRGGRGGNGRRSRDRGAAPDTAGPDTAGPDVAAQDVVPASPGAEAPTPDEPAAPAAAGRSPVVEAPVVELPADAPGDSTAADAPVVDAPAAEAPLLAGPSGAAVDGAAVDGAAVDGAAVDTAAGAPEAAVEEAVVERERTARTGPAEPSRGAAEEPAAAGNGRRPRRRGRVTRGAGAPAGDAPAVAVLTVPAAVPAAAVDAVPAEAAPAATAPVDGAQVDGAPVVPPPPPAAARPRRARRTASRPAGPPADDAAGGGDPV